MKTYRAKILAVSPKLRQASLQLENTDRSAGCMLGYSLGNAEFSAAKVAGMIAWIDQRFERCAILVGDNIYRIALQIDAGLAEADALTEALRIGRERIADLTTLTRAAERCRFTILPCSEVVQHPYYAECRAALDALYQDDAGFARSVAGFSSSFLRRRGAETEAALTLSRTYLAEELAIMACLVRDGHETFIYPGNLAIAAELAAGLHPAAPPELCRMTSVALDVRPRGAAVSPANARATA